MDSQEPPRFDRREALWSTSRLALGGVLGSLLAAAGCRSPAVYRDFPSGSPTGYIIDPALCTHCFDCERVCRCDAIGFTGHEATADEPACRTCWVDLEKCCACGRCYRVCDVNAIVPCYGADKIPAREIGRAPAEPPKCPSSSGGGGGCGGGHCGGG